MVRPYAPKAPTRGAAWGLLRCPASFRIGGTSGSVTKLVHPCSSPVEEHPDAVLLAGIAEHRRTLRPVERSFVRALAGEHLQKSVHILDGRRGQDHHGSPFSGELFSLGHQPVG